MPFEKTASSSDAMRRMKESLSQLETEHGRLAGLSLQPKPGDIFICTPPKCGTTLLCAILHSLRSKGDFSFEEINLVIPCLEMAYDYGYTDINARQPGAPPRVFKTHAWYPHVPKLVDTGSRTEHEAVKYIFCCRNPVDAAYSFYCFFKDWFFTENEISVDAFIAEFILQRGEARDMMSNASQWHNIASWYPRRHDPNVLFLFYEDIVQDRQQAVEIISSFLQLAMDDPEVKRIAVQQSDIEFMRQHPTKYDEHMLKNARNQACGLDARAGLTRSCSGKVREGKVGGGQSFLSAATLQSMKKKWDEVILPVTGYASYEDMRSGVSKELNRCEAWGRGGSGRGDERK